MHQLAPTVTACVAQSVSARDTLVPPIALTPVWRRVVECSVLGPVVQVRTMNGTPEINGRHPEGDEKEEIR